MRLKLPRPWRRRLEPVDDGSRSKTSTLEEQVQELGVMLRRRREDQGLSLRDLATQTRITTPVIEALERGWTDRLPERAYLASMLPQLERRLDLEPGCLNPLLPASAVTQRNNLRGGRGRFTPGSIDVFTTWQGSVVYAAVIALSLLAINRQQQELVLRNSLSLEPVRADIQAISSQSALTGSDPRILALRPLEQARQRTPEQWMRSAGGPPTEPEGVLELQLKEPRQLQLSSRGGDRLKLKTGAGSLTLRLQAPVELRLTPAAGESDRVLWNGQLLKPLPDRAGQYRVNTPEQGKKDD